MNSICPPNPYEFRDAEEIIDRLGMERGDMEKRLKPNKYEAFRNTSEELEQIVRRSVGSNTFRAFRKSMCNEIQRRIREITGLAEVPAIYFDVLACDMSHKGKTASSADDLMSQAMALPVRERAALAQQLLHCLKPEDPDSEEAWAEEIMAGSDALHSGDVTVHDSREAIEDIRNRLPRTQPH